MKRKGLLIIYLLFFTSIYAQTSKHTFSLGLGVENAYNEMLLPYNYQGISINTDYVFEKNYKNQWKILINPELSFSFSNLKHNITSIPLSSIRRNDYFVQLDFLSLKKIFNTNRISLYAGLVSSLQLVYQRINNNEIYSRSLSREFLNLSFSEGISLFFHYRLNAISIYNTISYHLFTVSLYPNLPNNTFLDGRMKDYFTFSSIGKRNYINNQLKVELPLFLRRKSASSFVVFYTFKYEQSTIKDNRIEQISNIFNVGFDIKVNSRQ